MSPFSRVFSYFKPYKARVALTLLAAVGSTLAAMVPPAIWGYTIDEVIPSGNLTVFLGVVGIALAAMVARDGLNSLRIRWNNRLEQQVILDLRNDLYRHLQRLSQRFYSDRSTGELMSRVVEDVAHVERVLLDGTEQVVVAALTLFGVGILMFLHSPLLTFVALIPIPILIAGAIWYTTRRRQVYRQAREASAQMNATLHDSLAGLTQIKIFGREREQAARFNNDADGYRRAQLNVMYTWSFFSPGMNLLGGMGVVLVMLVGGRALILGEAGISLGMLFTFYGYLNLFYEPINRLHALYNLWQDALSSSERVFEVLDTPPDVDDPPTPRVLSKPARGVVTFDGVGFAYDAQRPILRGIDLQVAAGETVAIVGPTGAGKTTLVQLIPRFYDVTSGAVRIDGVDVRDLKLQDLRSQIALVSQEPFLFNGTIRENILLGRPTASEEELERAAELANVADFVRRLPDRYDTPVGERGVKLSVGEKQRISIARALIKDAPIIILDEATASVDTITEYQIQEALERLRLGRTTFIIAHRLSTVRDADRILCLKDGRVLESGTHDELIRMGGFYAALIEHQNHGTAVTLHT